VAHVGHKLVLVLAGDFEVLDSLGKLTRPRLNFFEKARVLNGDDGLVRESIDELDLTFGERAHFGEPDEDYANSHACVEQRDGEQSAITELERTSPTLRGFIRFGQDVCDLYRAPIEDGAAGDEPRHQRKRQLSNLN
jgi:hypothetical protein